MGKPIRSVEINGERWTVDLIPANGQTLHAYKTIQIDSRLSKSSPREFMNTCIHELLHVIFPSATEAQVLNAGNVISRFLWRTGFRCK